MIHYLNMLKCTLALRLGPEQPAGLNKVMHKLSYLQVRLMRKLVLLYL